MSEKIKKNRKGSGKACVCLFAAALALVGCAPSGHTSEGSPPSDVIGESATASGESVVPADGTTPVEHSPCENLAYMAERLLSADYYALTMQGSVTVKVFITVKQTVETYKQCRDGVMLMANISKSTFVNTATQFCFVGDDAVLYRDAATDAADWNGPKTQWKTSEPGRMTPEEYKETYGLSGMAFSVYVLNEDTVLSATEAVASEKDGETFYTQTFTLDPDGDAAAYYYRRQMMATGGLSDYPQFECITVTYVFDGEWRVISSSVNEKYKASMGSMLSVNCVAAYETTYDYAENAADMSDYENFYRNYL